MFVVNKGRNFGFTPVLGVVLLKCFATRLLMLWRFKPVAIAHLTTNLAHLILGTPKTSPTSFHTDVLQIRH